ncbi:uncharacterized protein LOC100175574 [Ciona intestinalis]
MAVFEFIAVATAIASISILILCLPRKKKPRVTATSYTPATELPSEVHTPSNHHSGKSNQERPASSETSSSQPQTEPLKNGEHRRPHSSSQISHSRELPQLPQMVGMVTDETNDSWRSSNQHTTDSVGDAGSNGGDDSPDTRHSSPRGRRLPTPPPEGETPVQHRQSITLNLQEDDTYAKVEEPSKENPVRLKIKTLDILEGSGDSSFYAKVRDGEENDLYAQVDDTTLKDDPKPIEGAHASPSPSTPLKSPKLDSPSDPNYAGAEYATIDKLKKSGASIKRKPASSEPPAPPIPDRNFDEDDMDPMAVAENLPYVDDELEPRESPPIQGPMYDKLCVRESLDHLRQRQEVEQERQQNYENILKEPQINPGDDYAQIEESNPEALYESLSAPGSADGAFAGNQQNGYASIEIPEILVHNPTPDIRLQPRRQHHYEQIERRPET